VKKLRVGVIYGGRSGEHEVSLASAAAVIQNLDPERYLPVAILIEKDGRWALPSRPPAITVAADVINAGRKELTEPSREAHLIAHPGGDTLLTVDRRPDGASVAGLGLDVVFPVLHGPYGEDGTVQGVLELAGLPYVGAGVLGSAIGMDKDVAKRLCLQAGIPVVPFRLVTAAELRREPKAAVARAAELGFPLFVKPANAGSSVGVTKVKEPSALEPALAHALAYDAKALCEAAVDAREIECAVLGNDEPEASVPGEIIVTHKDGFYSYEAKYVDPDGADFRIPADVPPEVAARVRALSVATFKALELAGMARVDFFLDRKSGALYVNEVNTIPGFTTIGMYSKMWAASGLAFPQLVDRLIALALERHAEKQQRRTSM